jgi:hypothetical protein
MGACELLLVCHCDNRGFVADEAGRRYCEKRARDPFKTDIDRDMVGIIRGFCCLEICSDGRLARINTNKERKWPFC